MIILIAILPMRFAIDQKRNPGELQTSLASMKHELLKVDQGKLGNDSKTYYYNVLANIDTITYSISGVRSFSEMTRANSLEARRNILLLTKQSDGFIKSIAGTSNAQWVAQYNTHLSKVRGFTEYAPLWVILAIAVSLGLGTMIGWKRIVVTIGEKIGKTHLNYAQGASAELIAASTITVSSMFGLPVSTTHVLSSGIAGTMVADSGFKNLQKKTVAAIGIAWLITLPVTILFSGLLFLLFRMLFV
jgi:PiT family inorganic phosphate transporter